MQLQAGQREHGHEWDAQSKGPQNPQAPSAGHTNGEDGDPYAGGDWAVVLPEGFHVFSVHSDRIRRTLLVAVEDLQCALALCDTPVERVMRRIGNRLCSALMVSVVGVAGCGGHAKAAHRSPGSGEVRTPRLSSPVSSVFTQPGAKLAVGESAAVPFEIPGSFPGSSPVFWLRIRVVSLTKDANTGTGAPGRPYSLITITNMGALDPAAYLFAAIPDLKSTGTVGFAGGFGDLSSCDGPPPPRRLPKGASWSSCQGFLASRPVTGVTYTGSDYRYESSPIAWK